MLNHGKGKNCFWTICGDLRGADAVIEVKSTRRLSPGSELCIQYSDEGNEALLFRYGFVEENNMGDLVMLRCPLGPHSEWDEAMSAKVKLMTVRCSKIDGPYFQEEASSTGSTVAAHSMPLPAALPGWLFHCVVARIALLSRLFTDSAAQQSVPIGNGCLLDGLSQVC